MAHKASLKRRAETLDYSVHTKQSKYDSKSNLSSSSEDEDAKPKPATKSSRGVAMMTKMGYKEGKGLGKHEQGIVDVIATSTQKGRRGLGYELSDIKLDKKFEWTLDKESDYVACKENVDWMKSCPDPPPVDQDLKSWTSNGPRKLTIHDEITFCDAEILKAVITCKDVFDRLSGHELRKARSMSNPFETVEKGIFINRAAMKMANIDSRFDFMFTNFKHNNESPLQKEDLLYFADICAGPGGFSEYVLWKKGWEAKGFGFTLRGPTDFKLEEFYAGSADTFEAHYGTDATGGDGDIYNPNNLVAFRNHVLHLTEGKGVHFVMADGGFSVEGKENIQEILSKRLYLCQFLCALGILRVGGHFICKLFDLFTPFSVGLIYIMYRCFEKVCIFKPNTSRPANSERYLICKSKRERTTDVENYLFKINCHLDSVTANNSENENDVTHVVPLHILKKDKDFNKYIRESNINIGRRQIHFLLKVKAFAEDPKLIDTKQNELKRKCFELWKVPLIGRSIPTKPPPEQRFRELTKNAHIKEYAFKPSILTKQLLKSGKSALEDPRNFKCVVLSGEDVYATTSKTDRGFLLSLGKNNVSYWDGLISSGWKRLDLRICLPADTLVYAEQVIELKGEGHAQRKNGAIHIIDALFIGGKDLRELDFTDRILYAHKLIKAVNKPTIHDLVKIRVKDVYDFVDVDKLISEKLDMRECKGGARKVRLCYDVDSEKFIDPCGLLIFPTTNDRFVCKFSKSFKKEYFWKKNTKDASVYVKPKEAIAPFNVTYSGRIF